MKSRYMRMGGSTLIEDLEMLSFVCNSFHLSSTRSRLNEKRRTDNFAQRVSGSPTRNPRVFHPDEPLSTPTFLGLQEMRCCIDGNPCHPRPEVGVLRGSVGAQ